MENLPSQEETSLGVLDYNAVRNAIEKQFKTKSEKTVHLQMRNDLKLASTLQYMGLLPLSSNLKKLIPI